MYIYIYIDNNKSVAVRFLTVFYFSSDTFKLGRSSIIKKKIILIFFLQSGGFLLGWRIRETTIQLRVA